MSYIFLSNYSKYSNELFPGKNNSLILNTNNIVSIKKKSESSVK